jgi:NADH-quinone oxidoreductase subunit D
MDWSGPERLQMNMGPQHPSAHGVFRAIVTLEGETVVAVDAVIGYLHRCHEKLSETLTYAQYPSIASKTDYVAAMTSEFAYVMAAEEIGKFEVPKRAQYLRVIVAELQRIASHLLWLGTWCMDMGGALGGGATIFLYCIRERELVLDLFEALVGARLLYGFFQVGGVRYDVPEGGRPSAATVNLIEQRLLDARPARGQCVLPPAGRRALASSPRDLAKKSASAVRCCAGPVWRLTSGARIHARPTATSSSPCRSRPRVIASRGTVRMVEFRESIRIVRQILDGLPEGHISSRPGVKSVAQVRVPKGET